MHSRYKHRSSALPEGPLGGLSSLSLITKGSWIHLWGRVAKPFVSSLMPVPQHFIRAKDDRSGGDNNWSFKMCKALVKSSPSTNQHPTFYRPDALPVSQPTVFSVIVYSAGEIRLDVTNLTGVKDDFLGSTP